MNGIDPSGEMLLLNLSVALLVSALIYIALKPLADIAVGFMKTEGSYEDGKLKYRILMSRMESGNISGDEAVELIKAPFKRAIKETVIPLLNTPGMLNTGPAYGPSFSLSTAGLSEAKRIAKYYIKSQRILKPLNNASMARKTISAIKDHMNDAGYMWISSSSAKMGGYFKAAQYNKGLPSPSEVNKQVYKILSQLEDY